MAISNFCVIKSKLRLFTELFTVTQTDSLARFPVSGLQKKSTLRWIEANFEANNLIEPDKLQEAIRKFAASFMIVSENL